MSLECHNLLTDFVGNVMSNIDNSKSGKKIFN